MASSPPRIGECQGEFMTIDDVETLMSAMADSGWNYTTDGFKSLVPTEDMVRLIESVKDVLRQEKNIINVVAPKTTPEQEIPHEVKVIGDLHGQFYDFVNLYNLLGRPSAHNILVFNGDFVDRGSWGLEIIVTLFLLKVLFPTFVYLVRGNHETSTCTKSFGFEKEVLAKYQDDGKAVYKEILSAFIHLPLAIVVSHSPRKFTRHTKRIGKSSTSGDAGGVFISHGGLFRQKGGGIGSLSTLMAVRRTIADPEDSAVEDILWSDPTPNDGIHTNKLRGCAMMYGPDIVRKFLRESECKLIVRSHEGPDARKKRRNTMESMGRGYTIDVGDDDDDGTIKPRLVTVFSAPNYPEGSSECSQGAFVTLSSHAGFSPTFQSYEGSPAPPLHSKVI